MTNVLSIHAVHQGGMRVVAGSDKHQVVMDYPRQPEDAAEGLTPLQMLLASLAGCSASTVSLLLKKMNQPFTGLEVEARAFRRHEHPTVLTEISLEFLVKGSGVAPESVAQALKASEERLCPVWNMLKCGTPIKASFSIVEDPVAAHAMH